MKGRRWELDWRLPALLRKRNSLRLFKMDAPLASCSIDSPPTPSLQVTSEGPAQPADLTLINSCLN